MDMHYVLCAMCCVLCVIVMLSLHGNLVGKKKNRVDMFHYLVGSKCPRLSYGGLLVPQLDNNFEYCRLNGESCSAIGWDYTPGGSLMRNKSHTCHLNLIRMCAHLLQTESIVASNIHPAGPLPQD